MRGLAALLLAALLALPVSVWGPLSAQSQERAVPPPEVLSPPNYEAFRLCRVALLFHLDTRSWDGARYPREVAEVLLQQMHFVMAEYVFGNPSDSVTRSVARVQAAERFFFDISDIVRQRGDELRELSTREEVLDGCVGVVWTSLRFEIDRLLRERKALIGLPEALKHVPED